MDNNNNNDLLTNYLVQLSSLLKSLNDFNFYEKINEINQVMTAISVLKDDFQGEINMKELTEKNSQITDLTKQIKTFIDNIIKAKQSESASILGKLQKMQNFKKIATYER